MEEEKMSEEGFCKDHDKDKSMYEKPLGKLFLTIITIYSFILAILALTYDKNIFLFLPKTTIVVGISSFLLLFVVTVNNLKLYNEKLPKLVQSSLEKYSLNIVVMIICWLSFSFLFNIYYFNTTIQRFWLTILFALSLIMFGVPVILFQLSATLEQITALFHDKIVLYERIKTIKEWLKKYRLGVIAFFITFNILYMSFYFYFWVGSEQIILFLDWVFFIELLIMFILPDLIFYSINIQNKCRAKKEIKKKEKTENNIEKEKEKKDN